MGGWVGERVDDLSQSPMFHHTRRFVLGGWVGGEGRTHQVVLVAIDQGGHELGGREDRRGAAQVNGVGGQEVPDVVRQRLWFGIHTCM